MAEKTTKLRFSAIIAVAIVIVAVTVLFFVVSRTPDTSENNNFQQPPEIEKSISEVLDGMTWTTLRDEKLGFEISIPTWFEPTVKYAPMCTVDCYRSLREDAGGSWSYIRTSGEYRELTTVEVRSYSFDSDLDMEAFWVDINQIQDYYTPGPTLRDEQINGVMLRRETGVDTVRSGFNEIAVFFADGRYHVFEIVIYTDTQFLETETFRIAMKDIWNTILSSFTIIE